MRERSHSQVIKIEICNRRIYGTCNLYWVCAAVKDQAVLQEQETRRLGCVLRNR